jgi:SAM-dependent methyltransferase
MTSFAAGQIARRYLPSRYHYWYCVGKLALDPLYEIVSKALRNDGAPLLDVGCGLGLLLHCLRASGCTAPYVGIDNDGAKLELARRSASGWGDARFELCDLSRDFPPHRGSVALLDVLQYLEPDEQHALLSKATQCLTPEAMLIMRGGLDDGSWRASLTRVADRFGHAVRWMGPSFKAQPRPEELAAALRAHGLRADFRPAWGRTPFNNWLITARLGPRS